LSSTDGGASAGSAELADGKLLLDHPAEQVARLTISNAAKRNALDHAILDAIATTVEALDARCVILTGAAGMFSAGYDIGGMPEETFAAEAEKLVAHPFATAISALESYPYPILASLPGPAIGGGLEVALACDLRIAAAGVKLGMPPAKLGLVYSHTGLQMFLDTIGAARTRELFLVGRNIPAERALEWGLVNSVVAPDELEAATLALAQEIAANAPLSLSGNKRVIAELLRARGALDAETEEELVELRRACFTSADFREGVRAFAEKRAPRWQSR
jgi:enoyl-CoA hydratase/carnithine racemase